MQRGLAKWRNGGPPSGAYFWAIIELAREIPSGFTLILDGDASAEADGYPIPSWPEDFTERLGRLEDLSGMSLEDFARVFGLPEERAREWRSGGMPTWAMALWASQILGGSDVLLAPVPTPSQAGVGTMGRQQELIYHVAREEFPQDFPERLEAFVEAAGLTWRGLARLLKVNTRIVRRRRAGSKPGSGHMVNLFDLAAGMRLLHILLPSVGELEGTGTVEAATGKTNRPWRRAKPPRGNEGRAVQSARPFSRSP